MIQSIILGLSALSSITGFSSGMTYEMSENDWNIISSNIGTTLVISETEVYRSNYVLEIRDLYNMAGENQYIEVIFENDGYLIYDKKNDKICEKSFTKLSDPYKDFSQNFNIYNEYFFDFKYATFDENHFINVATNSYLSFEDGLSTFVESESNTAGNYYHLNEIPISDNAHIINDAYYFLNLNGYHAWNSVGTCSIVSSEILLGYYDTFYNDLIVPESFDVRTIEKTDENPKVSDFSQSPSVDRHEYSDEDFHQYLVDIAKNEVGDDPEVDGMSTKNQIDLIKKYLNKQDIDYTLRTSEGNFGDILSERALVIIKNAINANRPVISNGTNHSTVAFAYDDDYVWVHTGWGWVGATPWSTYESNLFNNYSAGAIDIQYTGNHVHSDNYYSNNLNRYLCPCGTNFTSTTITPEDYGFEQEYFFYNKEHTFEVGDLSIRTYRLRTGFIENEYINLSPKRENAGDAFLEYWFSKPVRSFDLNLSYWQIKDVLSPLNSTAYFSVLYKNDDGNYYWVHATDLLNDISLTTDRYNQNNYQYSYIKNEIYGFRFVMQAPATGSSNSGRLSIGNINLIREL